jgi:glycosyltransferase involved in cell wall biosynthesis
MTKVAIVHDWLVDSGGAEKVLHSIISCFPDADIFSSVEYLTDDNKWIVHNKDVKTSFIQRLPNSKKYRKYLPFMFFAMENIDLSSYNLIISSSSSVAKSLIVGPDQIHICYCHSPMRYAWDMQNKYLSEIGLNNGVMSLLVRYVLFKLRTIDVRTSNSVDYFIANSHYIKRRINKCYRRDAEVIYPNVEVDDFPLVIEKEDFYFTCSRLVPYKRVDLIVSSFKNLPNKKLIVIGDGPEFSKIAKIAPPNVTLLGYQNFNVLKDYMSRAKAFIYAAEEDFGIVPVEAQACGTPVIAFNKGGLVETVIENKTGIFFDKQTEESLVNAINYFEEIATSFNPVEIRENANRFSNKRFILQFKSFVEQKLLNN